MCRLLIASRDALNSYRKEYDLFSLFSYLEATCGGHGNGFAIYDEKGFCFKKDKGVALSYKEINTILNDVEKMYSNSKTKRNQSYTFIFHTRIASCGLKKDENCHPFFFGPKNNNCLCMNGTLSNYIDMANVLGITDTEVIVNILKDVKDVDIFLEALVTERAVFVGMINGKPYAIKGYGDLAEYNPIEEKASIKPKGKRLYKNPFFFFASSFPAGIKHVKKVETGTIFYDDGRFISKRSINRYGYPHILNNNRFNYRYCGWEDEDVPVSYEDSIYRHYRDLGKDDDDIKEQDFEVPIEISDIK